MVKLLTSFEKSQHSFYQNKYLTPMATLKYSYLSGAVMISYFLFLFIFIDQNIVRREWIYFSSPNIC